MSRKPSLSKPVLFVDLDGTVIDSIKWWVDLYNLDHDTEYTKDDIKTYALDKINLKPYFYNYQGADWVPGAKQGIKRLSKYYDIVYVTVGFGKMWLAQRVEVTTDNFIHIKNRGFLRGYGLIDDYDENLLAFKGNRFMVKQPWNNGRTWEEITEELINEAKCFTAYGVLSYPVTNKLRPAVD